MRIYLDMCCYNRPYDPQEQLIIYLETQAKLHIQEMVKAGKLQLATSYTLDYEVSNVPDEERKAVIKQFMNEYASVHVGIRNRNKVEQKAVEIMKTGLKEKDAEHVSAAILSGCDC